MTKTIPKENISIVFTDAPSSLTLGEASQYMYRPETVSRIYRYSPAIKLIMCFRDPADRAYSHFRMNKRRGKQEGSFSAQVEAQINKFKSTGMCHEDPEFDYLGLGRYGEILETFLNFFHMDQIKIVWTEDLNEFRKKTVEDVIQFLGIMGGIDESVVLRKYHVGGDIRFPVLYKLFQAIPQKIPEKIKIAIKRIVGFDRLGGILHRVETQFFVNSKDEKLDQYTKARLDEFYASDVELLESLIGVKVPWR